MALTAFKTHFQKTLFETLDGDSELQDLLKGPDKVGTYVDPDTDYPYVTCGDNELDEWTTKDKGGWDIEAIIKVWSDQQGWEEASTIADRITNLLTGTPLVYDESSNHYAVGRAVAMPNKNMEDPDEKIRFMILKFQFYAKEV